MKPNRASVSTEPHLGTALRRDIVEEVARLGSTLIGFAPVARWADAGEVPPDYRPDAIWHLARTVIVMGVPMLLPIVESTPSINYQEMYNASNVLLDQIAFRLSLFLNDRGFPAIPIPRDGYGNLEILLKRMPASFSHVYAGKYAGLGTIGFSHNLINPRFGPRARYVSYSRPRKSRATRSSRKTSARSASYAENSVRRRRWPRAQACCRPSSMPWLAPSIISFSYRNRAGPAVSVLKSAR
jgi:hypothetical protein